MLLLTLDCTTSTHLMLSLPILGPIPRSFGLHRYQERCQDLSLLQQLLTLRLLLIALGDARFLRGEYPTHPIPMQ